MFRSLYVSFLLVSCLKPAPIRRHFIVVWIQTERRLKNKYIFESSRGKVFVIFSASTNYLGPSSSSRTCVAGSHCAKCKTTEKMLTCWDSCRICERFWDGAALSRRHRSRNNKTIEGIYGAGIAPVMGENSGEIHRMQRRVCFSKSGDFIVHTDSVFSRLRFYSIAGLVGVARYWALDIYGIRDSSGFMWKISE